jgi:hypothetical protein
VPLHQFYAFGTFQKDMLEVKRLTLTERLVPQQSLFGKIETFCIYHSKINWLEFLRKYESKTTLSNYYYLKNLMEKIILSQE